MITDGHRVIIFGFSPQNSEDAGRWPWLSVWPGRRPGRAPGTRQITARGRLAGFRRELYRCFTARADALAELCDAALCKQDRVHMLAELSLEPGHRRGHGALYDALNCGKVQASRLRWALAGVALPGLG